MVIRIMIMVPIYAISSLISLFSLEAAFVIDAIRDIYEVGPIFWLGDSGVEVSQQDKNCGWSRRRPW